MSDRSPCPDLKALAAGKYRVNREESYHAEHGERGRSADLWLWFIPCLHGHVFPFGAGLLGASTDRRGGIARRLAALPGGRAHQDGDDGLTVVFPEAMFETVASILKARRRKRWSDARRAKAAAEGRLFGVKPPIQLASSEQRRDISCRVDSEAEF